MLRTVTVEVKAPIDPKRRVHFFNGGSEKLIVDVRDHDLERELLNIVPPAQVTFEVGSGDVIERVVESKTVEQ